VSKPHFLNVDLVIQSRSNLAALAAEFEKRAYVLHCGRMGGDYFLAVESNRQFKTPDATVRALCATVSALSAQGKRLWRSAYRKEFDVGYDLASEGYESHFALRSDTLKRIASLGATLAVTFYDPKRMTSGPP
jgi:hypothetical protein